jgi:hypothetical protein
MAQAYPGRTKVDNATSERGHILCDHYRILTSGQRETTAQGKEISPMISSQGALSRAKHRPDQENFNGANSGKGISEKLGWPLAHGRMPAKSFFFVIECAGSFRYHTSGSHHEP